MCLVFVAFCLYYPTVPFWGQSAAFTFSVHTLTQTEESLSLLQVRFFSPPHSNFKHRVIWGTGAHLLMCRTAELWKRSAQNTQNKMLPLLKYSFEMFEPKLSLQLSCCLLKFINYNLISLLFCSIVALPVQQSWCIDINMRNAKEQRFMPQNISQAAMAEWLGEYRWMKDKLR